MRNPAAEVTRNFGPTPSSSEEETSEVLSSGCRCQIQDLGTTMFKARSLGSVTIPLCRASRHQSPLVRCTFSSRTSSGHLAISRMALGDTLSRVSYLIPHNVIFLISCRLLLPLTNQTLRGKYCAFLKCDTIDCDWSIEIRN